MTSKTKGRNMNDDMIVLNQKDASWFFDMFENPCEPNDALKEAFARYNSKKITNEGTGSCSTFKIN